MFFRAQSLERLSTGVLLVAMALSTGCTRGDARAPQSIAPLPASGVGHYRLEVLHVWPHDAGAFTQGLLFYGDALVESTGLYGQSRLREVDWRTGSVRKEVTIPQQYFAEGLAVLGGKAYQLTWKHEVGFIYDADTFQRLGDFHYSGEGWGLTTDGTHLILSDGTNRIRFLDPRTFEVARTIEVKLDGNPRDRLNELEWVHGQLFANVWQTDSILRIDPATGSVRGVIDCAGLLSPADRRQNTDVLNGIAYDEKADRLIITGKNWPKLYEVRVVEAR
jgi:glutamine cyclotransferase